MERFDLPEESLAHYGTPRHSGRYPWGSGDNPYQRYKNFYSFVTDKRKSGVSDVEIAKSMNMTTSQLRARMSISKDEIRKANVATALKLKDKGWSNVAIGEHLGMPESSVRNLLNPALQERSALTNAVADQLAKAVDEKGYIDIGVGVENHLGISRTKLKTSVSLLEEQGYKVNYIQTDQFGTNHKTSIMVLAKDDVPYTEIYENKDKISLPTNFYMEEGGTVCRAVEPPVSVSSDRVQIRYNEQGGVDKDGVIELRRGVDDISLGNASYAQVRIAVDGTHYLKGMAVYSDNLPDGVDILFNTNKHEGTPKMDVLKKMKSDPNNPFGASIKDEEDLRLAQKHYIGEDGKEHLSAINVVNEEGNWGEWSKTLSSQVLSKQPVPLAKQQLDLAYKVREDEWHDIQSLTEPTVKKQLMESFAEDCDAAAVHLKAAALPRQASHVILPVTSLADNEIYAPNYQDGEKVVLIRYPHGGRFEIPELVVNNKNAEARSVIGNAPDAVGITPKVAGKLSGADFDGDTVLVIPNNEGKIKTAPSLKGLENFEPKEQYAGYEGMPKMNERQRGIEMGKITNLITDMTLQMAPEEDVVRAVKHSMVVIDAYKHGLDYKRSEAENGIAELNEKYRGRSNAGASTLISRASAEAHVDDRVEGVIVKDKETGAKKRMYVDPNTGEKLYTYTGATYNKPVKDKKTGEIIGWKEEKKTISSTRMAETKDAFDLSSGTMIESVYATYANKLKALGNEARKVALSIRPRPYDPGARGVYQREVSSLDAKLHDAEKNAPIERQAQLRADYLFKQRKADNPNMATEEIKKVRGQCLTQARKETGAYKNRVVITDREWEAIQNGAISPNKLSRILRNTDMDAVKQRAMPRVSTGIPTGKLQQAKAMLKNGYTQAEVAEQLGVSTSTLNKALTQ